VSPHILPQHHDALEDLYDRAQAGIVPWSEVRAYQASIMPRCAEHPDRPAHVLWDTMPCCVECAARIAKERGNHHAPKA